MDRPLRIYIYVISAWLLISPGVAFAQETGASLDSLQETLSRGLENNDLKIIEETSLSLYEYFRRAEQFQRALEYYEIFHQARQEQENEHKKPTISDIISKDSALDPALVEDKIGLLTRSKFLLFLFVLLLGIGTLAYFLIHSMDKLQKVKKKFKGVEEEVSLKENQIEVQKKRIFNLSESLHQKELFLSQRDERIRELNQLIKIKDKKLVLLPEKPEPSTRSIIVRPEIIDKKSKDTMDSISYAKQIQDAMLPKLEVIQQSLPETFILFQPRDMVSGDFYWFDSKNHRTIISAIDCTGHGVPGAFLSMIGNEILNKIVNFMGISEPDKILNRLQLEMRNTLRQKENGNEDGMDIGICSIHMVPPGLEDLFGQPRLEYAGAHNSLIYIKNKQLYRLRGDRIPIGGYLYEEDHKFKKYSIDISEPVTFYLFSDGYQDQFGGEPRKKFMLPRFRNLLLEIHELPMSEQQTILKERLEDWMGPYPQLDDILIIGVKVHSSPHN